MVIRRRQRTLPGVDALLLHKIASVLYFGLAAVILAEGVGTTTWSSAHVEHPWFLPVPIVIQVKQAAPLTIPLGLLALALVAGLALGLPFGFAAARNFPFARAVDVTELPAKDWSALLLPLPPDSGESMWAERWLGRGQGQRALSLLALALAVLLPLGFFVAYLAVSWYGVSQFPDCVGSRCPPSYSVFNLPPVILGISISYLIQYGRVRLVERRCGIRFRVPEGRVPGAFTHYVRAPGVTPQDAATVLARYTHDSHRGQSRRGSERPAAQRALLTTLYFLPYFLAQTMLSLLVAWLPTQWTPT